MRSHLLAAVLVAATASLSAQSGPTAPPPKPKPDVTTLVSRMSLDSYKATIKGLTQFGDRRQGTKRNREAVDWIEAQLKSYGCPTGRIGTSTRPTRQTRRPLAAAAAARPVAVAALAAAVAGRASRWRPAMSRASPAAAGRAAPARAPASTTIRWRQTDEKLRALNAEPAKDGERQEVYCTKVGTTLPNEMYIVGAHMDGHGWGEAANDDGRAPRS